MYFYPPIDLHMVFELIKLDKLDFCLFRTWYILPAKFKSEIDKKSSSLIFQKDFSNWFFKNEVQIKKGIMWLQKYLDLIASPAVLCNASKQTNIERFSIQWKVSKRRLVFLTSIWSMHKVIKSLKILS
jgi:hypothetical protein